MRLWRISDFTDLSGVGGLLEAARWHSQGRRIVYLSDHPVSALLEILVHLEVDASDVPDSFQLLTVDVADDVAFDVVETSDLPADWQGRADTAQTLGGQWLAASRTVLLRVPSAIVPFAWNWLMNPGHPDVPRLSIVDVRRVAFDPRLFS